MLGESRGGQRRVGGGKKSGRIKGKIRKAGRRGKRERKGIEGEGNAKDGAGGAKGSRC
jgi:hypothetical protein